MLGVALPQGRKAYAHRLLAQTPVLNDRIGDRPVLVAFDVEAGAAVAFDPTVDGRVLSFEDGGVLNGAAVLRDQETFTLWAVLSGEAVDGALAGRRLEALPAFSVFWFAWSDYFPGTALYEPPPEG